MRYVIVYELPKVEAEYWHPNLIDTERIKHAAFHISQPEIQRIAGPGPVTVPAC